MARRLKTYNPHAIQENVAKEFAKVSGYVGAQGGWIYREHPGDRPGPVCQGWSEFFLKFRREILDHLCMKFTGFADFTSLLNAPGGYRPTIQVSENWRLLVLLTEYNRAQARRNDDRRAFVPEWPANMTIGFRAIFEGTR